MSHSVEQKNNSKTLDNSQEGFEDVSHLNLEKYILRLYIASHSQKSLRALEKIQKICEERLKGRYELEVIDIYQEPERLEQDQVFAVPTLIKEQPPPLKKLIGDMTDTEQVIISLAI